jgi:hypothetical protein
MVRKKKNIVKENEPYVLPADDKELESFIRKYNLDLTQQVVSSIEFAVKNRLPIIEAFQFKGSSFVVTITAKEFDSNLENIYNYYLDNEYYELCKRVLDIRGEIQKYPNEKTKQKTTRFQ